MELVREQERGMAAFVGAGGEKGLGVPRRRKCCPFGGSGWWTGAGMQQRAKEAVLRHECHESGIPDTAWRLEVGHNNELACGRRRGKRCGSEMPSGGGSVKMPSEEEGIASQLARRIESLLDGCFGTIFQFLPSKTFLESLLEMLLA